MKNIHLKGVSSIGISKDQERNQIANFAYIEWKDNLNILDTAPNVYWTKAVQDIPDHTLEQIMAAHALPQSWFNMGYHDFLEARRILMAEVIKKGFEKLGD